MGFSEATVQLRIMQLHIEELFYKIISCICFFCLININWPNLVNVCLGTPYPKPYSSPNFHPRIIKKGHSNPKWMDYDVT